jgi:hypothetical protein
LERLEEKQVLSLPGAGTTLGFITSARIAAEVRALPTSQRIATVARRVAISTPSFTNIKLYPVNVVEGQNFNHVLIATFTVKSTGKTVPQLTAGILKPDLARPYVIDQVVALKSTGNGHYAVYLSGTCVAVPPVSKHSQLPLWGSVEVLDVAAARATKDLVELVEFHIADAPLSPFQGNNPIKVAVGLDTGMVDLAGFADPNPLVNFANTKYQVSIDWGDPNDPNNPAPTTFIGKQAQAAGVGYVSGSPEDWEIYSHHTYANPGKFNIVIKVVDDPPDVGGAGKQTVTLHTQAIVAAETTLEMNGPAFVIGGQPLPPPPETYGIAGWIENIPNGATKLDYEVNVDWGDGKSTKFHSLYDEGNYAIVDDHASQYPPPPRGSSSDAHIDYTITITVTGPGIDPKKPLVGKQVVHVY